ncbi:FAD-binding domain-containing protein [Euzebya tangerina]|uniref:FAD-binding domain-containing protein n=1 Tax=Euzebya tangerina TaxID=591198 RepID=UPI000E317451|nr:FAD-binding domain-containing protein [Euzebya tangerina]
MPQLPTPTLGDAVSWVAEHLGHLCSDEPRASEAFTGGQTAADQALADYDVRGYAGKRNEVWPPSRRGASKLSPYIRYSLLPLPRVWEHVAGGPQRDVKKFRDELLWQEFARHAYARLGHRLAEPLRGEPVVSPDPPEDPWDRRMACMDVVMEELETDGWMVNQTRMWAASQWSVRHGATWREGEDRMFTHLLDGSRAANRLGWQWTIGTGTTKRYGFSRWQVEKRAPDLCQSCDLRNSCPIQSWPSAGKEAPRLDRVDPLIKRDPDLEFTRGPLVTQQAGVPEMVWLTAESLGDADPALQAHPEVPVVFVFDEPLLEGLRLSGKRLVFLTQTLADLATRRDMTVCLGDPAEDLRGTDVATTFAPVPGWRSRSAQVSVVATHPWPWLRPPHDRSIQSFTAWRKALS